MNNYLNVTRKIGCKGKGGKVKIKYENVENAEM
jgi:hypothetical protein